jgi:dTDP-4-amino-4,6-dideoxygalactose transaminase
MMDCGIETRPMFYPINEHQYLINNPNVNIVSDCKIASLLNKEIIILPSYPTLSREEQSFICGKIIQYIND